MGGKHLCADRDDQHITLWVLVAENDRIYVTQAD